ncbi:MAG: DUF3592 domain-containing protein [Candidatus Hodarchaeales archaeon]
MSSKSLSWTEGTLDKYPIGKRVDVYFDPVNPTKAVIEPSINIRTWMFAGLALIFFIVAWVFGYFFMRI